MKQNPVFDRLTALADPIRARLLLILERHELTVGELRAALQLPQSTVSRHLRALADGGWVVSREDGTSNRYRMTARELDPAARKLWLSIRDEVSAMATAARDAERVRGVIAARHTASQRFFASSAGQWDRLREELFGSRTELYPLLGLLDRAAVVAPGHPDLLHLRGLVAMGRGARAEAISWLERATRAAAVDRAAVRATEVPLAALQASLRVAELAVSLADRSIASAASDLDVARRLAAAAGRSAAETVEANLPYVESAEARGVFAQSAVSAMASLDRAAV